MSEPGAVAEATEDVVPAVRHWGVHRRPDRLRGRCVRVGSVLVDPLPLEEDLGPVEAIVLQSATHQRSSWRLRRELGVRVWAPRGAATLLEKADEAYDDGHELPGGLRAIRTPGPEEHHFALLRPGEPGVLFTADLLMLGSGGELAFVPGEYHDDPAATRESVRGFLGLPFGVLCLAHGGPVRDDPKGAIRRLLEKAG